MEENKTSGFRLTLLDIVTSSIANMFGTTISYPIDTIKVRIQSAKTENDKKLLFAIRRTLS
jgi:hypothetical protein